MSHIKTALLVSGTLLATGAFLNLASSGVFGAQVKTAADYIIQGLGK